MKSSIKIFFLNSEIKKKKTDVIDFRDEFRVAQFGALGKGVLERFGDSVVGERIERRWQISFIRQAAVQQIHDVGDQDAGTG